ncbi:hypothetical protein FB480_10586 [Agrobacterium vitis]|nr:hypothetical protein FB480_10586 [Agrobacterium vitis]
MNCARILWLLTPMFDVGWNADRVELCDVNPWFGVDFMVAVYVKTPGVACCKQCALVVHILIRYTNL